MIKPDFVEKRTNYEGLVSDFASAELVVVGAGFDGTSSYRSGSRFAPIALRGETILAQEDYSPYFKVDLKDCKIHDLGDIELPFGNKMEALRRIESASAYIVDTGKKPFFIGGEHLITLPAITPLIKKYPDLHLIHFDAHLDLIDILFGEKISHGTVMRRISELLPENKRIYQAGIRSGSPEEYAYAENNTILSEFDTTVLLTKLDQLKDKPVYLSVDLDVFDPSLIPGTGTPEAGGIFFAEFINALRKIAGLNLVGADMVELAPQIDPTQNSTIIASKIMREILIALSH